MSDSSILLVDDEKVILQILSRELRAENYKVTAVSSGSDAIRELQTAQYDLVISDLMMEGIDGFGVLKAVKEMAPLTRIIILTGYGDLKSAIDALRLGADDFLVKPCEIEELLFRIRLSLEKRNLLQLLMEKTLKLEAEIARCRLLEEQLLKKSDT